jgi:hypothetical protein
MVKEIYLRLSIFYYKKQSVVYKYKKEAVS